MLLILNKSKQVVGTLARYGTTNKVTPYFEDNHVEDLSSGAETFTFSTFANTKESYNLTVGNSIAFKIENGYKLFQITEVTETHKEDFIKSVYCEMVGIELINEIVRPFKNTSMSIKQFANTILQDTDYQLGYVDSSLALVHDINIDKATKVYSLIQDYLISKYEAEVSYRVAIEGGKVVGKYIDLYAERGDFKGTRFEYSKDITSVTKTVDSSELVTALIGLGKNNIDFKSISASDKPANQDYIVNQEAYELYNLNGSHIMDVYNYDTESPQELLTATRKELARRSTPKIKYVVDVELLDTKVSVGDTVYIVDNEFNPPLHLSARVSQLSTCRTDKTKSKCTLANYKEVVSSITDDMRNIASIIDDRFPIKESDISNGAVSGDKIKDNAIQQSHIVKNSITTEHLQANLITSDKIEAGQIKAEHILANQIKTEHLKAGLITAEKVQADAIESKHIKAESIDATHIKADAIETDHIKANQVVGSHILAGEIKANHLATNSVTADKIQSGTITGDKIYGSTITGDKLQANSITTRELKADSISSDKIQANAITTDKLDANSITSDKVGANQILAGHIKAGQIQATHIKAGAITSDKISAGAITSDKIGANSITSDKISAGSITANKLSTGELITDTAQIKTGLISTAHIGDGQITSAKIGKGVIGSAHITEGSILNAHIKAGAIDNAKIKDATIESAKIKSLVANKITSGTINTGLINIDGTNGKLRIRDNRLQVFDASATPKERVSIGDVNGDGSKYGFRVRGADGTTVLYDETGVYNEGITDGAITNPKIGDNAVDSRILNLKELFVEDSAFIENLHATKIKASQLEVDTIRNDLINLNGVVSFEAMNEDMGSLFIRPEGVDKTYINGGNIFAKSISADAIELKGLSIVKDGYSTLVISEEGDVSLTGDIASKDYSDVVGNERGYKLSANGDAVLNNAIVRGDVILPNGGMTNYGGNGNPVRFWAGASYENRDKAPFKVYQDGSIEATRGNFGGTFTGSLDIGNIHISDTNTTEAVLEIKDNNDVNTKIRLTDKSAEYFVPFKVGNTLSVNPTTGSVDFGKGTSLQLSNSSDMLNLNTRVGADYRPIQIQGNAGGVHNLLTKDGYSGVTWESLGTNIGGYDLKFRREVGSHNAKVSIEGNLIVSKKITMHDNNKIELVSVEGTNSGIDFMIR